MKKEKQIHEIKESDYYNVDETAKFLNIDKTAVRNYLSQGKLTTYKFKSFTLVSVEEAKQWKKEKSRR